jgi:hypothetical protein
MRSECELTTPVSVGERPVTHSATLPAATLMVSYGSGVGVGEIDALGVGVGISFPAVL